MDEGQCQLELMQLCTGATTCTYYHGAGTAGTMVGTVLR